MGGVVKVSSEVEKKAEVIKWRAARFGWGYLASR
jgi:hypothetical protein